MKKTAAVICAIVMVLSLASCGKSTPDYALGTVWGEITKINGTKVTLTLGKVTEEDVMPEMPDMPGDNAGGTPPEMPNGEVPAEPNGQSGSTRGEGGGKPGGSSGNGGTPPEKPGNTGSGDMPSMPGGEAGGFGMQKNVSFTAGSVTLTVELADAVITEGQTAISVSDLAVGKVLCVRFGEDGKPSSAEVVTTGTSGPSGGQDPGNGGGMNGGGTKVDQGSSANTVSENGSYSGKTFVSTEDNENALRIDGATVDFDNITVDKSAGATSNAENGDFYGVNAAILATNGATVTIKKSTVTSATRNGNGVFSYGSGTTVNIHDTKITTTAVLAAAYLCRTKIIKPAAADFLPKGKVIGRTLLLGLCSLLAQISLVAAMAAINNMIRKYGASDEIFGQEQYAQIPMAVIGIVMKFFQIVISVVIGMAAGCIPIVGFNIGARKYKRVKKLFSLLLTAEAVVGAIALIVVEVFPQGLIGIFGAKNESIYYTEFAIRSFRMYLCMIVLACINKAAFIFLQAMGRAVESTMLSMVREIVFGVGFALLLPLFFGLDGVLYSMPVSDVLTAVVTAVVIVNTYRRLDRAEADAN